MLPDVARWQTEMADRLHIVPISRGDLEVNRARNAEHNLKNCLLQADREVAEAYKVLATPTAVLLANGRIASWLLEGSREIGELMARLSRPPALKKGEPAPSLSLPDLDGKTVDLASLRGRRRLLLFWDPGCGFCQGMLGDMKSWERNPPKGAPELLVISKGASPAIREQGFRARVLLDPEFGAGIVFGAEGTPAAVILDEEGRVASSVGVGAPGVLALAGAVPATDGQPA